MTVTDWYKQTVYDANDKKVGGGVANDARAWGVRLRHSSWEADEQGGAIRCGAGGAKGGGRGEYAFAGNWSAKIEYDYLGFGTERITVVSVPGVTPPSRQFDVRQRIKNSQIIETTDIASRGWTRSDVTEAHGRRKGVLSASNLKLLAGRRAAVANWRFG